MWYVFVVWAWPTPFTIRQKLVRVCVVVGTKATYKLNVNVHSGHLLMLCIFLSFAYRYVFVTYYFLLPNGAVIHQWTRGILLF